MSAHPLLSDALRQFFHRGHNDHICQIYRHLAAGWILINIILVNDCSILSRKMSKYPLVHLLLYLLQLCDAGAGVSNAHHIFQCAAVATGSAVMALQKVGIWGGCIDVLVISFGSDIGIVAIEIVEYPLRKAMALTGFSWTAAW